MICQFYTKGNCRNREQCKFHHIPDTGSEKSASDDTLVHVSPPQEPMPLKVRRLRHPPNPFPRGSEMIQLLKSINPRQKIITYWGLSSNGVGHDIVPMIYSGNFDMDKGHVTSTTEIELLIRFEPCLRSGGILKIGVREFTGEVDEKAKVPLKDLYAYQSCNGGAIERLGKVESQIFHQQISQMLNEAYARYC